MLLVEQSPKLPSKSLSANAIVYLSVTGAILTFTFLLWQQGIHSTIPEIPAHTSHRPLPLMAVGIIPMGMIAIGVVPMGIIAIGIVPMGLISFGLVAMGAIAAGLQAMGLIRIGRH